MDAACRMARRVAPPAREAGDWSALMVRVARTRDPDSFMRIYDHFAPRLHRYLLGRGVPATRAEDLVQDAMLHAWRGACQFDPRRATVSTWLFRIARNLHIDSARRAAVAAYGEDLALAGDPGPALELVQEPSPEAYADHVGLSRAIDALPALQARLVRMSFLEARSHGEIANELRMPLGSVKSSLRRAFARLQHGLTDAAA